jgi:phosphohistidine phosphatase
MKALLIRHAAAVPRGTPGVLDDERPLTSSGTARFRAAARGLARITPRPDVLLTSPLPRARATAEIAARAFEQIEPGIAPALASQNVDGIVTALETQSRDATVALVGHEPVLGALLARMLGSGQAARLAFKKGGAALVDLPDGPATPGRLIWFLDPRILRTLADPDPGVARTSRAANGGRALRKRKPS